MMRGDHVDAIRTHFDYVPVRPTVITTLRSEDVSGTVLPVADDGSRLGHVMIDPKQGLNGFTARSVINHYERED